MLALFQALQIQAEADASFHLSNHDSQFSLHETFSSGGECFTPEIPDTSVYLNCFAVNREEYVEWKIFVYDEVFLAELILVCVLTG